MWHNIIGKQMKAKFIPWNNQFIHSSPLFSDIRQILPEIPCIQWPEIEALEQLLQLDATSLYGKTIKLVKQDNHIPYPELTYEERIYYHGLISTRLRNWHDFFNAIVWKLFPHIKTLMNALHISEISRQFGSQRNHARDAITHLDESGVLIAASDPDLIQLLRKHQWKTIFVTQKNQWHTHISAYIIGHGIYEKALHPFIGLTAKMYPVQVPKHFFQLTRLAQLQSLDKIISEHIQQFQTLRDNQFLSPLPILGIPGWYYPQDMEFYQDTNYFRALSE